MILEALFYKYNHSLVIWVKGLEVIERVRKKGKIKEFREKQGPFEWVMQVRDKNIVKATYEPSERKVLSGKCLPAFLIWFHTDLNKKCFRRTELST